MGELLRRKPTRAGCGSYREGEGESLGLVLGVQLAWLRVLSVSVSDLGKASRRAHRTKDLRTLSAEEVRIVVPSGDLE